MKRYNNTVINPTGQAIAGAQIVVTKAATPPGSGAPASLFSDDGVTAISNTVVADNLGRFGFFAPDGKYDLAVSGGTPLVSTPYILAAEEITDVLEFNPLDQQPIAAQLLNFTQVTSGAVPPTGSTNLYAKSTDRMLYYKDALGVETGPLGTGGGSVSGNVALKPMKSDSVCYVSTNGNDTNDGLSIGTAKLTVYACLTQVLPGGDSTHAGSGTVLLSGNPSYGGPVANQGFWLMGGQDPNFANPPTGWLKVNSLGPPAIKLDCFAPFEAGGTGSHIPHCGMVAGSNGSPLLPAVWMSAISGNISISNLSFSNYIGNFIRWGIDSNGNRNGSGGSQGLFLYNTSMGNGNCLASPTQSGPSIDIGSNCFWMWLEHNTIGGCPAKIFAVAAGGAVRNNNVTTITTTAPSDITTGELVTIANVPDDSFNVSPIVTVVDSTHFTYPNNGPNTTSGTGQVITARYAAINIDSGTTGAGTGLIWIKNTNLDGGNIRYKQGLNGGGFYVSGVSYEGTGQGPTGPPDAPIVLITGTSSTSNGDGTNIRIEDIEVSDPNVTAPGVRVDNSGGVAQDMVIVSRVAGYLKGKMTVLGNSSIIANPGTPRASYLSQQQFGLRNGQLIATGVDVARRGFSPTVARATNLANYNPANWAFISGNGTITTGISAPDGTNNAGRATFISGIPSAAVQFYYSTTLLNIGDYYVGGAWVRSNTGNGYVSSVYPINLVFSANGFGAGDSCAPPPSIATNGSPQIIGNASPIQLNDGQWQWYSLVCKVASNPTMPGTALLGYTDANHQMDFYAPTLYLFPAGTISDNEAYEIANNMGSTAPGAAAGEVSMLPSQLFRPGSTNFTALGTPNNGVLVYCSDCAITSPCSGGGTGAIAKRLGGQWVCT